MSTFTTRWDILPPEQKRLWPYLRCVSDLGFVLYGGTEVALRLGHRQSIDFAFFTSAPLDKRAIAESLPFAGTAHVLQETTQSWTMLASDDALSQNPVRVSFFGNIGNGRIGVPEFTDDGNVLTASLADLMAFKVKVILQRMEAKDYQDIAAMLAGGESLEQALSTARTLFGSAFQPMESLKALTCFDGGDLHTLSPACREILLAAARQRMRLQPVSLLSTHLTPDP